MQEMGLEPASTDMGRWPRRSRPALAPAGGEGSGSRSGPGGTHGRDGEDDNPASGRLDSLEEKLAAIERQFG